eukprot:1586984-Pyramimonas_sp.AAC.1
MAKPADASEDSVDITPQKRPKIMKKPSTVEECCDDGNKYDDDGEKSDSEVSRASNSMLT